MSWWRPAGVEACHPCPGRGCQRCYGTQMVLPPETPEQAQTRERRARELLRNGYVTILTPCEAETASGIILRATGAPFLICEVAAHV